MLQYHAVGLRSRGSRRRLRHNHAAADAAAKDTAYPNLLDVAEMLALPSLDAVSIITPNRFHKPLAVQAQRQTHLLREASCPQRR